MLEGRHRLGAFSVGKASSADVFVADLKLGTHELNEAHLIHESDVRLLEDLDVGNGLPCGRGETTVKGKVPEKSVNSVE